MPVAALGGEARAQFAVTAYVAPRVSVSTVRQPEALTVSAEDVRRGYVDVHAIYRVQGNDPAGYLVRLAPRTGIGSAVEVQGLASPVVLRDEIVEVVQPGTRTAQQLSLRIRVRLDPAAQAGIYALPVHFAVTTL